MASQKGSWEPLPLIVYGYAIHPLSQSQSRRDTRISNRARLSTVTEGGDDHLLHRDVVSLEVGDEIYAFEKYSPRGKEVDGVWYRGYVVCTTRRPPVTWASSSDPSTIKSVSTKTEEPQQVFIGIFPASHIHVRDELSDAEGRLTEVATSLKVPKADVHQQWTRDKVNSGMNDDDKSFRLGPPPDQANSSRAGLSVYPVSLRSASPDSQTMKPLPPRPSLKSGDDTAFGATEPIVDEIASALREWHTLMFQYLARRDYKLFHTVRDHIEALHLGRRQLLAQTLSREETVDLRKECAARLVSGNVAQGLDIIVRHPSAGGLVMVDVDGEIDRRSWVSAVRMYSMQTSLAYLNVGPNVELPNASSTTFPDHSRPKIVQGCLGPPPPTKQATAKFYHIYLELRAFVASPCGPGETAELFFSLYSPAKSKFITEEFCVVLNYNGVLARNPAAKIRTLFIDLAHTDVDSPIFLVCRIVRNGGLKIGNGMNTGVEHGRRGSEASTREPSSSVGWDSSSQFSPTNGRSPMGGESVSQFRRPFGGAVLELTQVAQTVAERAESSTVREHAMPIFVPIQEFAFSMLHQHIIGNESKEFETSPRAQAMAVSAKVFRGDAPTIVRENSVLLQDVPHTLRLGFPDVVFPDDSRNELYVKLWSGSFAPSHGGSSRLSVANFARNQMGPANNNIQVTIEVRDQDGRTIENVISQGAGEPLMTQFQSMVFRACATPTFGELVKLQLPAEGTPQWHLFFTFKNRASKDKMTSRAGPDAGDRPFAFAFQPLFPDGRAFVEDASHELILYKADKLSTITPDIYLNASVWAPGDRRGEPTSPADFQRVAPAMKDTLTIRTSLCSTKFTQNPVLLNLLSWEKLADKELLSTVLTKFFFVGEAEIVKFLRDIFDSLFGIMVSSMNQAREMDHLVFNAMVTVLRIVTDRRFSNFQPVLDVYIAEHFSCPAASSHIVQSMNRLLTSPASTETAPALRAALKVWHYIFKFIARARQLQKIKESGMGGGVTADHLESKFKGELRTHLNEVNRMMSTSSPAAIIGTQTIALQHFTSILPELSNIFSTVELVGIATTFASSVNPGRSGKMVIWKLIMYLQIVKGYLFDDAHSRSTLVETVVNWIKPHFGTFDEYAHANLESETAREAARVGWLESIRLCVSIIAVMLDKLQQNLVEPEILGNRNLHRQEQDNVECLLSLLPRLLDSYREFQNPVSQQAMERTRSQSNAAAAIAVTFPETYPFSLIAFLPVPPKGAKGVAPAGKEPEVFFNPGLGETAIVFLVLILSSPKKHVLNFMEASLDIEGRDNFASFLSQLFKVSTSILDNDAFPSNWLNVNILAHKVLIKIMDPVSTLLHRAFIPPDEPSEDEATFDFDAELWKEGFYVLLKLLSSDQLVIEEFSPQKRRAVWRLAGDVRGEGANIILRLWTALGWPETVSLNGQETSQSGGYQVALSSLVGHVVNLCLSHHDQLRSNAVQMLYSMIVSEYHQFEHFDEIENELVNRLDSLFMSDSKGDDISRAFFIGQLRHLFDSSEVDPLLTERVASFLDSVDLFLELLLSVRALPEGEEYADDRVIATLRLMNFIRRIGRDEIYIKYVHQLVNMHLQSQNYVEAALTLKLHSDLHEWDLNTFVPPMEDLGLPQQSQFHRKETLCLLILDYLGKGKAWESAIEICKELAFQHSGVTFNYGRLSEILRHEAALLEHIVTDTRYYSEYFRVAFHGNFPVALRGKQFVYRGYEWEKFGAFCERMLNKHSGAQLLKTMGDPPPDVRFGNDQYIQCTAVTPEPDRTLAIFTNPDVPAAVRTYYEHSSINLFSCSRQLLKTTRDGSEELWLEKTYFTTEEAFPTVLRRSEVVGMEVQEISPVENALNEVEQTTKELAALHLKYYPLIKTSHVGSTNALAMALNSAVDAPVDTGIAYYRHVFFDPDYVVRNPDRVELVHKLSLAIEDQVRMIDACLRLHERLCPPEFLPFHETLEKFFRKNFRDEIRRMAADGTDFSDDEMTASPSSRTHHLPAPSTYQSSLNDSSMHHARSMSNVTSSNNRPPFVIPPISVGHGAMMSPPLESPRSPPAHAQGSTLQRNLAHLARHGIHGVAHGPGDSGNDSASGESPHDSFVNVGSNGVNGGFSSASVATASNFGSIRSGSTKGSHAGRISRKIGSLNFGRRS